MYSTIYKTIWLDRRADSPSVHLAQNKEIMVSIKDWVLMIWMQTSLRSRVALFAQIIQ